MVLSTTKRTSSIASITNQNHGGGSKKAGLSPQIGIGSWTQKSYASACVSCNLKNLQTNRFKLFPSQNLPIGFKSSIRMH